ncbi:MAG TPA: flagellin FliC, partial [Rhodobacteraceae bacterium]|nr:flagellin FliC [Paracoccaceae bacterium]
MREVAVQSANDTNNGQDRANLQAEMEAMVTEIDRIAGTTTWAGANLMDASAGTTFSFQVGAATGAQNQIAVSIGAMNATGLGVGDGTVSVVKVNDTVADDGSGDVNARTGIDLIDTAIKDVNIQRSKLGAISNRLNHTVNNLTNISS